MMQKTRRALEQDGYDGPGFSRLYDSLESALAGSTLHKEDSHTIQIGNIPNLGDVTVLLAMYENGAKKLGLAFLVDAGMDNIDSIRAKQRVSEMYERLVQFPGMADCSTEYTPWRTNREAVDENITNPELWEEKCERRLTLSYAAPDHEGSNVHCVLIKMDYKLQAAVLVKDLLEHAGAQFANHQ